MLANLCACLRARVAVCVFLRIVYAGYALVDELGEDGVVVGLAELLLAPLDDVDGGSDGFRDLGGAALGLGRIAALGARPLTAVVFASLGLGHAFKAAGCSCP